jgi:hypothetical protein
MIARQNSETARIIRQGIMHAVFGAEISGGIRLRQFSESIRFLRDVFLKFAENLRSLST